MEAARHPWPALGVLMLRDGLIEKDELEALLAEQAEVRQRRITSWRLGELLVERGTVTEEQVARLVAEQYELPYVELDEERVDAKLASRLPASLVDRFTALPVEVLDDGSAAVAVCDPAAVLFTDELRKALGMPIRFAVTAPAALKAAIVRARAGPAQHASSTPAWPSAASASDLVLDSEPGPPHDEARSASALAPPETGAWPPLGALLVRDELISEEELEAALAQQRLSSSKRLGEILVERGAVTRADVARVVAEQYELPFLDVAENEVDPEVLELLPLDLGERYGAIALKYQPDGALVVAVADPTTILDPSELAGGVDAELSFAVADPHVVESALQARRGLPPAETEPPVDEDVVRAGSADAAPVTLTIVPRDDEAEEEDVPALAPVVPLNGHDPGDDTGELDPLSAVENALGRAHELGATAVRFALDRRGLTARATLHTGVQELGALPRDLDPPALLRWLREAEYKTVVLPTRMGDVVYVRLTSDPVPDLTLDALGLDAAAEDAVRAALAERTGLVVVAGRPHERTVELAYGLLLDLVPLGRGVVTIEDPVVHRLPDVDQIEAGPESGLTVPQGLARILRADPDAIFVSESDDERTAELVARGAGRALVVTTSRAPTACAALRRLSALVGDPGLLGDGLRLAVGRTEVRRICVACRESYFASAAELEALGRPEDEAGRRLLGRGRGCERCGATGFDGSETLTELLAPTDDVRRWLAAGAPAAGEPSPTLRDQVVELCLDGVTTVAEARRALGTPVP